MEWREAFDDARQANDFDALFALEKELRSALNAKLLQVGSTLDKADFAAAAQEIRTCMFLEKFIADIAALEE